MRHLALALLLFAAPAFAAPVAMIKTQHITIYAYVEPCEVPSIAAALAKFGEARKAEVIYEGRDIRACYVVQDENVILLDQEGDGGVVPISAFVEAKGV